MSGMKRKRGTNSANPESDCASGDALENKMAVYNNAVRNERERVFKLLGASSDLPTLHDRV